MKTHLHILALTTLLTLMACEPSQAPEESFEASLVSGAAPYMTDRAHRRAALERSLWKPELPYAQKRLGSYALPKGGWDLLPEIKTTVAPLTTETAAKPESAPFDGADLLPETLPETLEGWIELGEQVFWRMPMRRDAYMTWLAQRPDLWDDVGLKADDQGQLRGLVRFEDARGAVRVGVTCGLCHGREGRAGWADRDVDLGRARVLWKQDRGQDPGEFGDWGPGRVDVTDDGMFDPLAIPNLFGVRHQSWINRSGSIALTDPTALAARFETQYIVGHAMEARPPRALTWALAVFVLSLDTAPEARPETEEGAAIFSTQCAGCHDPNRGFSGDLVPAEALTSDPSAANSPRRGTGFYKTPSLLGISGGGPFLHDASEPTLESLLIGGHPFGQALSDNDRNALLRFLDTL